MLREEASVVRDVRGSGVALTRLARETAMMALVMLEICMFKVCRSDEVTWVVLLLGHSQVQQ